MLSAIYASLCRSPAGEIGFASKFLRPQSVSAFPLAPSSPVVQSNDEGRVLAFYASFRIGDRCPDRLEPISLDGGGQVRC
jgi:hypothetical protein